jgi:ParB family chromosome partitioning protein
MPAKDGQTFTLPAKTNLNADLFSTQATRDDAQREKVQTIPLDQIDPFPEHPFHVREDEAMTAMVESVKAVGVLTPAVARQKEDGRYELVSGHRRKHACELAGLEAMPVIVREMTHDEAVIFMVESNFQREAILPSEKAFAYKMRLDAMKRQAGRPSKENASPVATNFPQGRSDVELGEITGESKDTIRRFIRLTYLIPALLQMVDDGKIAFRPAVELSYLPENEQEALLEAMEAEAATPSLAQAIKMKQFSQDGKLTPEVIESIMAEEKPNQKEQFKIPKERISRFFAPGTSAQKMEDTIVKALEQYRQRQRDKDAR